MLRSSLAAAAAVAALAFLVADAAANGDGYDDTVDLQVVGNAKVRGTIRNANERESFRMDLPQGAKVVAAARRKGRGKLVPQLDLQFGMDTVAGGTVRGPGSKIRTSALEASGDHLLRVFGDHTQDGDYQLTLKVLPQRRWKGTGTAAAGSFSNVFYFGAPANAMAKVRLTPARGSGFVPGLEGLFGPGAFQTVTLSGGSTSWIPLGDAGTYGVGFTDGGTEGGDWVCTVQLRLPRVPKSKIDISAKALTGDFGGTQQVYGAQIGSEGGIVDPPDLGGPLDGSSVSVPPGSLPFPVVITMNEAGDIVPPDPDNGAGPTIQFGPSGTEFDEGLPATITIPYDPEQFNDPESELTIYVRNDQTGEVEPVLPRESYDFSEYGFVSFPYNHFSSFAAAGSKPKSPAGDWQLAHLEGGPTGRFTWFEGQGLGRTYISPFGEGSTIDWKFVEASWADFGLVQQGVPDPTASFDQSSRQDFAYADFFNGGPNLFLYFGSEEFLSLLRSARGDVWFGNYFAHGYPAVQLGLRQSPGQPTFLTLAGRWHMFVVSTGARDDGTKGSPLVKLFAHASRATATLGLDGTWRIGGVSGRHAESPFSVGTWSVKAAALPPRATGGFEGFLKVEFPAPVGSTGGQSPEYLRFTSCLNGDVLLGCTQSADGDVPLVILVRESSRRTPAALAGTMTRYRYEREIVDGTGDPAVQRFRWTSQLEEAKYGLPKSLMVEAVERATYDVDATGATTTDFVLPDPVTATWSLAANGAYSDSTGMVGAVTPRGDLFVGAVVDGKRFAWVFGVPGEQFVFEQR